MSSRGTDRHFRPPALGDVAIDQDEAATWYGVAPHFDHRAVGARALKPQLAISVLEPAGQLGFDVAGAELASLGQHAKIVSIRRPCRQDCLAEPH